MILFDKLLTDQADVPIALKLCEQKYPSIWGELGDMAKARVEQNLREAVGERMDTDVILDPFLTEVNTQLRRTATNSGTLRLISYTHTTASSRGFYTRKDPKAALATCPYFDKEFNEWGNKTIDDIKVRFLMGPDNSVKGYFERNGGSGGKLPKRVRISRRYLAKLYIEWRASKYKDDHFPLSKMRKQFDDFGVNKDIACALIQGLSLKVDQLQHRRETMEGHIPLCNIKDEQTKDPYLTAEIVEPIYEKVRADKDAARMLFQAKTHVGKFTMSPTTPGSVLHEIRGASVDDENEVFLELDANTAGMNNTILFHPKSKFFKLPRYIRRNFWVRAKPGSKAEYNLKLFKGPKAHKGACQIRQIQLNTTTNQVELLLRTRRHGDCWLPLSDDLFTPKKVKGVWPSARISAEEQWQKYLGRRIHPPKPASKPVAKEATHPFGEPDEVFARTSAQAREALRPRDPEVVEPMGYADVPAPERPRPRIPRGATFATPPMLDPGMTQAQEIIERTVAEMLARPLTARDIEWAGEMLYG